MIGTRAKALLVLVALLGATFSGCLSLFGAEEEPIEKTSEEQKKAEALLGDEGTKKLEEVAAPAPKNYTFPGQELLAPVTHVVEGTIGTGSNAAIEGQNDQGGMDFGGVVVTEDVSKFIPAGQPVEIFIKLIWDGREGASADLDILVDLPGLKTSYFPRSEEFNWNIAVKTLAVNTVGVAGAPHIIGVKANNGRTTADVPFTLEIEFHYAKDVLTASVPYAFEVPANASGIIIESEKVAGEDHINSTFVIIDPNDELVQYVEYNDLAIPTESYFIPVSGPGEYIFYAQQMDGGFLRLKADYPLETFPVRALQTKLDTVVDASGPTPGMIEREWGRGGAVTAPTPMQNHQETTFDSGTTFPLEVRGFIGPGETLASQIIIESTKGVVYDTQRVAKHTDEEGNSIGYTRDETNTEIDWSKLAKGQYTVKVVNNGPVEVGHTVLTYVR